MAATSPRNYDPKPLFRTSSLGTTAIADNAAGGTQYTAPAEAGVRVDVITITAKTAASTTIRLGTNDNTTTWYILYDFAVPGDGLPVVLVGPWFLAASDRIKAVAGAVSILDVQGFGIEMADT